MSMRSALHRTRDRILSADAPALDSLIGVSYSVLSSMAEHRRCRVRKFDGAWLHEWSDGAYLCERPVRRPIVEVRHLYPLFFFRYTPKAGDIVIDVGAGVGTEAVEFSRLVGSRGTVVAIEAHPNSAQLCQQTADHLGLKNVTVLNAAVAATSGTVLISDKASSISNRLDDSGLAVPSGTLPDLLDDMGIRTVDYLKVNIEGAERLMLQGMNDSALVVRNICISCHDFIEGEWFQTFDFTRQWLLDHGYDVVTHPAVAREPYAQYYLYGTLPSAV